MNDLITIQKNELVVQQTDVMVVSRGMLAQLPIWLQRAYLTLESVVDMEDVQKYLLTGNGWSEHTVRSYMKSFNDFYTMTFENQRPVGRTMMLTTAAAIEIWLDSIIDQMAPRAVSLRLSGVKAVFRVIGRLAPGNNPFDDLPEGLEKKIKAATTEGPTALDPDEFSRLLTFAKKQKSPLDHAITLFLGTTGLRSEEMLNMTWEKMEKIDNVWWATGIGKGKKPFEIPVMGAVVSVVMDAFKTITGRLPVMEDPLFMRTATEPLVYSTMWRRVSKLGERAKRAGVISPRHTTFSPHTFRRTTATVLHSMGMPAKAIQQITRHSRLETLEKHYLKNNESPVPYWEKWANAHAGGVESLLASVA